MVNKNPFRIRWANYEDADLLIPLLMALYKHDVPDAPTPTCDSVSLHINNLLDTKTPHKLAIILNNKKLAVGLAAIAKFISISDPRPDNWIQLELKELFILEKYRNVGLGLTIMNWVEAEAKSVGACRIDWHVKKENTRGISFYEDFGASIVMNRLSMRKNIKFEN
jgi:GNAT superfamily N-acetyltransferase